VPIPDADVDAALAAWPGLGLDRAGLKARLESLDEGGPGKLKLADVALAYACARGNEKALAILEADRWPQVRAALAKTGNNPDHIEEAMQAVRKQCLAGERPAILGYAGRGDLVSWLRVVAVRELVRIATAAKRDVRPATGELDRVADDASDPEMLHLKRQYGAAYGEAVKDAIAALEPRERALLRCSVVERLSIDDLAAMYRVHRATAARWLEAARAALARKTRGLIGERLRLDTAELESIARLVESQIDVSVGRLLLDP
jgi:RNA polymerase sigma-70 factor (ECF subfamily)